MPTDVTHDALKTLRERVPRLLTTLGATAREADLAWLRTLDTRLLPRLSPDFPLIAAITGGGSAGKSTLFNSLVGAEVSTAGGRAGLNRRVLVAVHPEQTTRPDFLAELFLPFGAPPTPMGDRQVLTTPGPPVYVAQDALPRGVILLDTPDFDVGAAGAYLNRDVAAPVLSAADVLIYIFTNATYNAKANTDFICEQLTAIGRRPSVLVYRVYQSYSEADVRAHGETVAHNLYGDDWRDHVLAIFRADDDNAVAAGTAAMNPRHLDGGASLLETLSALAPRELRREQNGVMLADVARAAGATLDAARGDHALLGLYRDALRLAASHAVATALAELPLNRIVERIREVFEQTDPGFVRFSRRAGRITGAPFRGLMRLVKGADPAAAAPAVDPRELVRGSLIAAANTLRRQALGEEISAVTSAGDPDGASLIERVAAVRAARDLHGAERPLAESSHAGAGVNLFIAAPAALDAARASLLARDWSAALSRISEHASELLELPAALDAELVSIVADFRRDLPFVKRARAALVASLNLVPPVLGIVYVFATADPVGGTSISAKIGSLFGLNDLWATVSIPASSGLDDLTRAHLKRLLDPVVQRWLATRAEPVRALLDAEVAAPVLTDATQRVDAAGALLDAATAALGRLPTGAPP